ncbi:hypothetical protein, partial [Donghicola sp. XS_ASV15]|uniref:hypothetical protein n=1 Tax=Donghicola sp. XS_ASV15 TaxID=3241295 RepID=UPI00351970D8
PADPFAALADLGEPDTQEATGADDDMFAPFEVAKPDAEDSNAQLARLAAGGMAAFADDIAPQDGTQPGEDEAEPLPEDHAAELAQDHDAPGVEATEDIDADTFAAFSEDDHPFAALEGAEEEQGRDSLPSATDDIPIEAVAAVERTADTDPFAALEDEDPFAALADVDEPDAELSSPQDTDAPKDQMATADEEPQASEDAAAGTAVPSPFEALEGLDDDDAPPSEHVVSDDADALPL